MNMPLVYVIILNFNGKRYLNACLSSVILQTYPNCKTIVCDNASTDDSVKFVTDTFPSITLIRLTKNLGFAEGNNLAIKFALNHKADYVFLLNNDTTVDRDVLEKLINTAENDSSIGIIAPAIFDLTNQSSVQEMGMAIDKFGYPLAVKNHNENSLCTFFVSGSAMLIKSELIRRIGLFDERYFMFAEDLDLCWRAQLAGCKIAVNPSVKIYHASGASISGGVVKGSSYETNVRRVFLRERNTLRTLIKNYSLSNIVKVVPFYTVLLSVESAFWFLINRPKAAENILKAIFWNLKSFPDTIRERALIQRLRVVNDCAIVEKMVKGYCKVTIFRTVGIPNFNSSS